MSRGLVRPLTFVALGLTALGAASIIAIDAMLEGSDFYEYIGEDNPDNSEFTAPAWLGLAAASLAIYGLVVRSP